MFTDEQRKILQDTVSLATFGSIALLIATFLLQIKATELLDTTIFAFFGAGIFLIFDAVLLNFMAFFTKLKVSPSELEEFSFKWSDILQLPKRPFGWVAYFFFKRIFMAGMCLYLVAAIFAVAYFLSQ